MAKTIKINLGCGYDYRQGYINVDNHPNDFIKVDKEADILSLKWKKGTVDEILVSHVLMYMKPPDMFMLLKRWHSWLKKGGVLIIEQPDIKKIAQVIVNETNPFLIDEWGFVNVFGQTGSAPHVYGYYPEGMAISLYKAGFSQCWYEAGTKKPNRDFKITATK